MKSKILGLGFLAVGLLVSSENSYAGYLSTGVPVSEGTSAAGIRGAQFTLTSTVIINSVEHWASVDGLGDPNNPNDGGIDVRMSIWGNNSACSNPVNPSFPCPAGNPSSDQPLFGGVVRVQNGGPAWIGLTGLSWVLDPGTYWLVRSYAQPQGDLRSPFSTCVDGTQACGFFDGWDHEASWQPSFWAVNGARTGWRIGLPSAVPEPGTLALLGLGLAGLGLSRRRKA